MKCAKDEEDKCLAQKKNIKDMWKNISIIYLMNDMISRWNLTNMTLEKKIKIVSY